MSYHNPVYLFLFLPAVLLAYQLTPRKRRWILLLFAGYFFFWTISGKLVLYLIGTTFFTHYIGLWLDLLKTSCKEKGEKEKKLEKGREKAVRTQYRKKERLVLALGVCTLLGALACLKYYNFFAQNANLILEHAGQRGIFQVKNLLLPVGISFYTLQAISYMADVYWEKIRPQRHLGKLALFLGFFPQIMEGPISMYGQTGEALWKGEDLRGENLSAGCARILWGLFKKMIIADRLYVLVTAVFEHYQDYNGSIVAFAAIAYTLQLYMEFSGCMDIVIGSGRLFGVTLPENFCRPFASENAAQFWRRWHITLGTWLKTYVFYPLSVSRMVKKWNRFGKKHLGKYFTRLGATALCLFPVWLCNGLWHGASWNYIFYGMYYFVILLAGSALEPARDQMIRVFGINQNALYWKIPRILKTWVIIFVGELFFRANGLKAGLTMFFSIFKDFRLNTLWDGTFLGFGLDKGDYMVIFGGILLVSAAGIIKERNLLNGKGLQDMKTPFRWAVYYGLILAVLIFGAYGIGYQQVDLIYAGF